MIKKFFWFLIHPGITKTPEPSTVFETGAIIFKGLALYFGFIVVSSLIFFTLLTHFDLLPKHNNVFLHAPLSFRLLFLVPLYEELIFRLPLKYSKLNLFSAIAIFQFIWFFHVINPVLLAFIAVAILSIPYLNLISENISTKIGAIWSNNFPVVFYGLAFCFGFVHLSNFENLRLAHYLVSPLIVSNQIFMGLLFGYLRMTYKNGLVYCCLLHFLINLPIILISQL